MNEKKFDPQKLEKLNNPQRLVDIPLDVIASQLSLKNGDTFVDIGAGTGFFSIAFLEQFQPKQIYACELSDLLLDWMKNHVVHKYSQIIPIKTQESSIPLDDQIADLVFMIVLHHELDDPKTNLREAMRLLKSGGQVLIIDWKKQDMNQGPPLEIRCLPEDVQNELATVGFRDIQICDKLPKHFMITAQKR